MTMKLYGVVSGLFLPGTLGICDAAVELPWPILLWRMGLRDSYCLGVRRWAEMQIRFGLVTAVLV